MPELCQMAAQGVDGLHALPYQKLSDPNDHRRPLGHFAFAGTIPAPWRGDRGVGRCKLARARIGAVRPQQR
jgi:hypothetical protein